MNDHGTGADNAVLSDVHPFADDGAVADPCILTDMNSPGISERMNTVVYVVPVGIGNISAAGNHAVVCDDNFFRGTDPDARANQAIITDLDFSLVFMLGPDRKSDLVVGCGNNICVPADFNGGAENFDIPGVQKCKAVSKIIKLRFYKIPGVKFLEF